MAEVYPGDLTFENEINQPLAHLGHRRWKLFYLVLRNGGLPILSLIVPGTNGIALILFVYS
jgi:hypothetical protein